MTSEKWNHNLMMVFTLMVPTLHLTARVESPVEGGEVRRCLGSRPMEGPRRPSVQAEIPVAVLLTVRSHEEERTRSCKWFPVSTEVSSVCEMISKVWVIKTLWSRVFCSDASLSRKFYLSCLKINIYLVTTCQVYSLKLFLRNCDVYVGIISGWFVVSSTWRLVFVFLW